MVRRLRWGVPERAISGVRKPSPLARGRNHGLELSLMFVLQVNSGTVAEAKEVSKMRCPGRSMLSAAWALPICCLAELPREFLSEVLRLPIRAIAPNDPLGALEGVAFGCIVADADGDFRVEGADGDGTGCLQRVVHSCAEIVGIIFNGHVGPPCPHLGRCD